MYSFRPSSTGDDLRVLLTIDFLFGRLSITTLTAHGEPEGVAHIPLKDAEGFIAEVRGFQSRHERALSRKAEMDAKLVARQKEGAADV